MSHVNMGGMNGANALTGGMPILNHATNGATPTRVDSDEQESQDYGPRLNAYIYDYFMGQEMYDCARAMHKSRTPMDPAPGNSENQMNGIKEDSGDSKKPADLPAANVGGSQSGVFLLDWFALFWDIFQAQRNRGQSQGRQSNASRYIEYNTVSVVPHRYPVRKLIPHEGRSKDEAGAASCDAQAKRDEPDGLPAARSPPEQFANER